MRRYEPGEIVTVRDMYYRILSAGSEGVRATRISAAEKHMWEAVQRGMARWRTA
jgi:hypothetical protein